MNTISELQVQANIVLNALEGVDTLTPPRTQQAKMLVQALCQYYGITWGECLDKIERVSKGEDVK